MKSLLPFIAALLSLGAQAQESASVQIRTLCFQRDASGISKLAVVTPNQPVVELKFPESFLSPKARVPTIEGSIVFYDPAKPGGPPIAVAKIPPGMSSAIVMFFPVEGDPNKMIYRTSVIDASLEGIPKDGALVMNLFSKEVRVVTGEHRVVIKPGASVGVARSKDRNDYNMSAVVFLAEGNGEWKTASETLVRFPKSQQQFFVSYPNGPSNRLAFRSFQIGNF